MSVAVGALTGKAVDPCVPGSQSRGRTFQRWAFCGFSVATLRNREQGRRAPDGPALALLRVAPTNPGGCGLTASAADGGECCQAAASETRSLNSRTRVVGILKRAQCAGRITSWSIRWWFTGKPVFAAREFPFAVALANLADSLSVEEITRSYPSLTPETVQAALAYAAISPRSASCNSRPPGRVGMRHRLRRGARRSRRSSPDRTKPSRASGTVHHRFGLRRCPGVSSDRPGGDRRVSSDQPESRRGARPCGDRDPNTGVQLGRGTAVDRGTRPRSLSQRRVVGRLTARWCRRRGTNAVAPRLIARR